MARVRAMSVSRVLATAMQRVREAVQRVREAMQGVRETWNGGTPDRAIESDSADAEAEDPVERARRANERARFEDDADYFRFLVKRAVEAGSEVR